jgi:hypothetical protein
MRNLIADVLESSGLSDHHHVLKAHHPTAPVYLEIKDSPCRYIYVARDIRDVIVSDMTLHDLANTFPRVAAMAVMPEALRSYKYWNAQADLYKTTYDSLIGDLAGHARGVADFLGADLTTQQAEEIAARHSEKKVRNQVASHYAQDPSAKATDIDSDVGFRKGHFQGGKTGKWMESLSPLQIAFIEFHSRSWLLDNGFTLSQSRGRRLAAGVLGAPFMLAGRIVVKIKRTLGLIEVY